MVNQHCNPHAHAELYDSIALLAPPWGSAVDFGGAKIRARIALSLGAVPPNPGLNSACNLYADGGFDDSITHMAPPWGSAVDFGGRGICARIALSLGAVRQNRGLNSALNLHADAGFVDSITPLAPQFGLQFTSGDQRFAPESRFRSELSARTVD